MLCLSFISYIHTLCRESLCTVQIQIWEIIKRILRNVLRKSKVKKCPISILPVLFLFFYLHVFFAVVVFMLLLLLNTQATPGNDVFRRKNYRLLQLDSVFFFPLEKSTLPHNKHRRSIVNFPFHSTHPPIYRAKPNQNTPHHDHPAHLTYQPYIIIT